MQIRVAEERDAATLLEIYSYYVEKTAITFEYETPSIEEFTQRIHDIKVKYPYMWQKRRERSWGMPMVRRFTRGLLMAGVRRCLVYCETLTGGAAVQEADSIEPWRVFLQRWEF